MIRMRRRFNYTSRQKIKMESIAIELFNAGEPDVSFSCDVNLSQYSFQNGAAIYVDVSRKSYAFKRFSLGTVGSPSIIQNIPLEEFSIYPALTFYVSVVDTREGYKHILGKSAAISLPRTKGESETTPLLEVFFKKGMKQIWKLDFDSGMPVLQVNSDITDIAEKLKRNHLFRASIFPAVLREILIYYLIIEHESINEEDEESAGARWIRFVKEVCGIAEIVEEDVEEDDLDLQTLGAIERIADAFSEKLLMKSVMKELDTKGERS